MAYARDISRHCKVVVSQHLAVSNAFFEANTFLQHPTAQFCHKQDMKGNDLKLEMNQLIVFQVQPEHPEQMIPNFKLEGGSTTAFSAWRKRWEIFLEDPLDVYFLNQKKETEV